MEMENKAPILLFDEASKTKILNLIGLEEKDSILIDEEGLIQTDQQYEEVSAKDFGGMLIGSKIVIKKESSDLVRYFLNQIH